MFDAIIVMAGTGARTGLAYNKNLYKIKGKPLFRYSLEAFLKVSQCSSVILVVHERDYLTVKSFISDIDATNITLVIGGPQRSDSVKNAIITAQKDIVLIHDAARPLIRPLKIIRVFEAALKSGYAALGMKVTDSIYKADKAAVSVLKRDELWQIQTPQAVRRKDYTDLLYRMQNKNISATDDIGLLIKELGIKPVLVAGDAYNIKATYEHDLIFLKELIERGYYEL